MHPISPSTTPPPRLIFWELTTGCNLRCAHCRASASELMSPDELGYAQCCRIVDEIAEFAPFILVLSGGEPLWRPDVFDIARRATRRGIRVALATNGTLVDEVMAERIRDSGIQRVAVSLDGVDPATHDRFRGQAGAFEAACNGLRCLREVGLSTQVNTTVARHNAHQLPRMLKLAAELGVDAFHLFLLVPVGCGLTISEQESVPAQQAEEILRWFYDQSLQTKLELKATCAPHYYRIVRQQRAESRHAGIPLAPLPATGMHSMTKGCLAGSGVCFLSSKGEVYPCGYLPVSAGNLLSEPFARIWEHAGIFRSLRGEDSLEGWCGVCEFQNVCSGCRARAYGVTGNYLAEEPDCLYMPKGWKPAMGCPGPRDTRVTAGKSAAPISVLRADN
ncbi:MAG: radical SAM protein [Acidobacteriia bacterium]|nr:radical SAM protein [Terriglobia bacterium]